MLQSDIGLYCLTFSSKVLILNHVDNILPNLGRKNGK